MTATTQPTATNQAMLYQGQVVHVRLRPRRHRLCYGVYTVLIDVDKIDEQLATSRLMSHNRFNLFSIYDRDHGAGDGTPLGAHARQLLAQADIDIGGGRIQLLAYPRLLGAVFNPLSVYYAQHEDGRLAGLIYEVNNTFGERRSYVIKAGPQLNGVYAQSCAKELSVSPFAPMSGRYGFRVTLPGPAILLGVQFHDRDGALIRTHFKATAGALTDKSLFGVALRYPLLTLKVVGGIHYEALKLWWKGVPVIRRQRSPRYAVTIVPAETH